MSAILKSSQVNYIKRPATLTVEELTAELEAMKCQVMVYKSIIKDQADEIERLMGIKGVKS